MLKKIAWFFYLLLMSMLVLFASTFFVLNNLEYENLVQTILKQIQREDLYNLIREHYFTIEKYKWIQQGSILFSITSIILIVLLIKKRKQFLNQIFNIEKYFINKIKSFVNCIIEQDKSIKLFFAIGIVAIFIRSIYYATSFYIQYDEAWNYNYFLNHNPIYSLFAYNNYPLHNLISWLFLSILPDNTFVLRLPSILFGVLTSAFIFVIIIKIFRQAILALCIMGVFACLPISVFYMLYARGVMIEMFFAFLLFYFLFQYFNTNINFKKVLFLSFLNALGVYSMLSHFYFIVISFGAVVIYILIAQKNTMKYAFYYLLLSIVFSFVLISPFFLGTGISLGTNAAISTQRLLTLHILPFHAYSDMMSGAWFLFYGMIIFNFYSLFYEKNKNYLLMIILNILLLISPLLIYIFTKTYPPERALAFISISTVLTFAIALNKINKFKRSQIAFSIIFILTLSFVTYKHDALNWSKQMDKEAYTIYQLFTQKEINIVYSESNNFKYYVPALIYYFSLHKKSFHYQTNDSSSTRFVNEMNDMTQCFVTDNPNQSGNLIHEFDGMYFYFLK